EWWLVGVEDCCLEHHCITFAEVPAHGKIEFRPVIRTAGLGGEVVERGLPLPLAASVAELRLQIVDAGIRRHEELIRPTLERVQRGKGGPERTSGDRVVAAERFGADAQRQAARTRP